LRGSTFGFFSDSDKGSFFVAAHFKKVGALGCGRRNAMQRQALIAFGMKSLKTNENGSAPLDESGYRREISRNKPHSGVRSFLKDAKH
jgi:hypothetical protein